MNAATDDPMFFTPNDFFDEVPMASPFTPHSNDTIPLSLGHHSDKFQYPVYPTSATTEWSYQQHQFDSLSSKSHNDSPSVSIDPHQSNHIIQPTSFLDLNSHLACPSSVATSMDTNPTSWMMMNSLDTTYLPEFDHALDFYEENRNGEKSFSYQSQSYISQDIPLSSQWIPPSYSHVDPVRLPFLDEYANLNCPESFPTLPHSFTNHEAVGQEVQSFLGYMPRAPSPPPPPSHHTSNMNLSHHSRSPFANNNNNNNEDMDDFSDSDTTTSTQSWIMSFPPQVPFQSCSDHNNNNDTSHHPIAGGMASSISAPLFSFDHHHHSDLLQQPMKSKSKKLTTTTNQGKVHRSNSSHTIQSRRKKTTMSQFQQQRRRESDPYLLLSTIHSTNNNNHNHESICFSAPPLSTSESIASLLSRQRLSEVEEESVETRGHHHHHQKKSKPYHSNIKGDTSSSCSSSSSSDDKDASVFRVPPRNPGIKKGRNVDKACNHCKRSHLRCDSMRPCRRCIATGKLECHDVEHKPRGRPRLHNT